MYHCLYHEENTTKYCQECRIEVPCDHSDQTFTRFKDLTYSCEEGERTVTLFLYHCNTCGKICGIQEKGKEL